MKELICNNAVFGIALCALTWQAGLWVAAKAKHPLVHPLVVAIALAVAALSAFQIPLEWFREGANYLDMLLLPATAARQAARIDRASPAWPPQAMFAVVTTSSMAASSPIDQSP